MNAGNPLGPFEIRPGALMPHPDSRPLRILVGADVPPDPNAGASGTVFYMNQALQRLGHHVDEIWQAELGRRITHGNLHYLLELPRAYRRAMRRRLQKESYDIVELNQPHAYLAAADFRRRVGNGVFVNRSHGHEVRSEESLERWRRVLGVPPQRGLRGLASRCMRSLLNRHWTQVARFSDGFHVSCTEDAEFLADRYGIPTERIGAVTQGIPEMFVNTPPQPMTDERRRRLLYAGQFAFFKAPMILAQAVSTILVARADLTMTWVCSQAHHSDVLALLAPEVRSRVTLLGWRPLEELMKVYDEHGVFLFPSFFEGFGKTPLEAMSRGMCVIASETGGMRDFIEDGCTGRLVPVGRADLLVQAALSVINDPEAFLRISSAARLSAVQHTWDRCAEDLTVFYRQLLARQSAEKNMRPGTR